MNELYIKLQNYSSTYSEEMVTKTKMLEFLNEYENPFS
ncbi:nucleoside triphosphate hydrolase [Candidatus Rickettsia barbariae]